MTDSPMLSAERLANTLIEIISKAKLRAFWRRAYGDEIGIIEGLVNDQWSNPGHAEEAQAILAALQAAGMVVMPVEPTEAMIHAAVTAPYGRTLGERVINEYRAMLAAGGAVATAPEAAATEEQG